MFRVSIDAWKELGDELQTAFDACKGKKELTDNEIVKFNLLFYIDCAVRDLINERIQELYEEGILNERK